MARRQGDPLGHVTIRVPKADGRAVVRTAPGAGTEVTLRLGYGNAWPEALGAPGS